MKKLVFLVSLCSIILLPAIARADVNNFTINNFHAKYVLDKNIEGGGLTTEENIDVNFTDYNHGILRAIPKKYHDLYTKLKIISVSRDGSTEKYTTSTQNGNLVLKIGAANQTITGAHNYKITYSNERVINFVNGKAEFFWDVNGNDWLQPFNKVTAEVQLKDQPISNQTHMDCYTGIKSSNASDCTGQTVDGSALFSSSRVLGSRENLTIVVPLTDVSFAPVKISMLEKLQQNKALHTTYILSPSILAAAGLSLLWFKKGKDYKRKGIIVPEYEAPPGLTPAEVGMLADYNVDGWDISATIIDLAVRGYLKIYEDSKKILFFTKKTYSLELLKIDYKDLKDHEKTMLSGLFADQNVGAKINMSDIRRNSSFLYSDIKTVRKSLKKSLEDKYGYIEKSGSKYSTWVSVVFIGLFVLSDLLLFNKTFLFNFIPLVIILMIFGSIMRRRSHAGQEVYEKILGLKMYMDVAQKQRFKMMQSTDRVYAEPSKTVDLYEKLLPFAVALGVEKSWSKQFDEVLTQNPAWISSNAVGFSSANFASSIGSVTSSFSQSFEASSGTSGSGGGGSSGGGGGGGGGGGW